jgi:putative SOS response-associated peptidase YedK
VCGRVTETDPRRILDELNIPGDVPELDATPRYNIPPTERVPVVRVLASSVGRRLDLLRWGLVPAWAKELAVGNRMINARVETLTEKSAFRDPLRLRRCLVVVDGFYEWQRQGRDKQPFYLRSAGGELLTMAGLWDAWVSPDGEVVESFAIVTKPAEPPLTDIHDRMPAILAPAHHEAWLDPARRDSEPLIGLLSLPSPPLLATPVSSRVNKPGYDNPDCLEPVATQPSLF